MDDRIKTICDCEVDVAAERERCKRLCEYHLRRPGPVTVLRFAQLLMDISMGVEVPGDVE